ncbi:MAG: Zn-dependent hydrolase [Acidocella sp. 35-58-6]|nr:MAG: Zn-dependent hydrolase [Acidocella sp. 35-58-6]
MIYPISDHHDGAQFFNPEATIRLQGGKRRGIISMLRTRWNRDPNVWAVWPKYIENAAYPPPAGEVPVGQVDVTFIGHASFLLRLPGLNVLTDPVFSKRCSPVGFIGPKRVRDPGLAIADLPKIDLLLLSHNHYDHCDVVSLQALHRKFPGMRIVTSLGNAKFLAGKRISGAAELDWWQTHGLGETRITAVPARHFSARTLNDRNKTLWAGFMLEHRGQKLYFAGDTGYTKFFTEIRERLGAPDIALLPIGAYEPRWFMGPVHMNPEDAVKAFADLGAKRAVGMHFGTFQLTAEAIDAPEKDLAIARDAAGLPGDAFTTLECGETRRF